ncbi:rod shape-determining protein [Flavobacteriaceae bacterium]|nr:rod shape-determining protein [Flavobacteriaceae bacterium]
MLKIKKYGAIDIGSNAIRLLISNVIKKNNKDPQFKKADIIRVPIRLGEDVFVKGHITEANAFRMTEAMKAFKLLMDVHGVEKYRACATSAMREASNGKEVRDQIQAASGIDIEIIDGKKEAEIISFTDLNESIDPDKSYLYVDVGGGSTEMTVISRGKIIASKSFKIGTVRLLNKTVNKKEIFADIEIWIKEHTADIEKIFLIGSGGNINKIFKMSGKPIGTSLSYAYLKAHFRFLKNMSYDDRILVLGLNTDRADVIVPATKIYLNAMKWSGAKKIFVPKIGLSDGLIKSMYFGKM